jgi:hypothetical protein
MQNGIEPGYAHAIGDFNQAALEDEKRAMWIPAPLKSRLIVLMSGNGLRFEEGDEYFHEMGSWQPVPPEFIGREISQVTKVRRVQQI